MDLLQDNFQIMINSIFDNKDKLINKIQQISEAKFLCKRATGISEKLIIIFQKKNLILAKRKISSKDIYFHYQKLEY